MNVYPLPVSVLVAMRRAAESHGAVFASGVQCGVFRWIRAGVGCACAAAILRGAGFVERGGHMVWQPTVN